MVMLNCSLKKGRSLIYIRNNNGPDNEPCGTLVLICDKFDSMPSKKNELFSVFKRVFNQI